MSYNCKFLKYWSPTTQHPYPMNFVQAPSKTNQLLIYYNGKPQLQGLSTVKGPFMYPVKDNNSKLSSNINKGHKNSAVQYPTTHSIPGPCLRSYIALPKKMYTY